MNKLIQRYRNSGVQREIKDVFYLIALQGLNYIAPLIVLPYLMVTLGAEKFGYIGFSLAVCQYLMLIVDFGFNLSATKRIALSKENQSELNKIFSATVYAKMGLLFVSFLILIMVSLIPQFAVYRSAMFVMFLSVVGNAFLFIFLFQGLGQIRWVSIVNAIAKLSILPITFLLVKTPNDYLWAAFVQSLVSIVAAAISLLIIYKNKWVRLVDFDKLTMIGEMKEGFPLFLSSAATSIYTACFILILGLFATPKEVGCYSAADRVMRALCYLVLVPILQSFYPKVSRMAKIATKQAESLIRKLLIVVLLGMGCVCCIMFFGSYFVVQLLGREYEGTQTLFKIMAFVPLFVGAGGVIGQLKLLAMGNEYDKKHFQQVYFIAAIVAVIGVLILSPLFLSIGAALALFITEFVVVFLLLIYGKKINVLN